jgi:hypothetical protein
MQKKILVMLAVFAFLVSGCASSNDDKAASDPVISAASGDAILPSQANGSCADQSQYSVTLNPRCVNQTGGPCLINVNPKSFCRNFARCDDSCNLVVAPEYEACVRCFADVNNGPSEGCLAQFPDFKKS